MENRNVAAIIGGGRISEVHADALNRYHQTVRIKYLVDPYLTPEMKEWGTRYRIENFTKDANDVFADDEVNCIFLCSPTPTHGQYILKACETKKNVYCEKPLEADIELIKNVMKEVEKSGIHFFMGFMRRFDKNQRRMKQLIEEGKIGTPHIVKLCSRDPAPPTYRYIETSGGVYLDSMVHDFDLARYFTGSEVTSVYALGSVRIDPKIGELGDVDTAIVTLQFTSGALGLIDLSRQSGCGYDQRTEVHGEKGTLQVENVLESTVQLSSAQGVTKDKPLYFFLERYFDGFVDAQKVFFEMVNNGTISPVTIYDGLQAMRIAMAAKKSFMEKRPVEISEIP